MINEIDKMALELKKIKKGFVIFYETLGEATPANFKIFDNVIDAFNFAKENKFLKGFYAEKKCWAVYESLEELRQRCIVEGMFQDELKAQEFLAFRRNR